MKKIIIAVMTVLLLLPLGGCHGSKGTAKFEIPDQFDESKQIEITFWAKNDTNMTQVNIYKKAIQDFQALYPNITVNMRLYTDYSRIYNDVITNISTNTTPNVCITYPDHIATYLTGNNVVVPLDELFKDEKYGFGGSELKYDSPKKTEIVSEFLQEGIIGENTYAIPYMRSTEACYINKTYVEKLGYEIPDILTWDFIWEVSEAATKKDESGVYEINGQKVMIPFIYKSTDNMMIQALYQLEKEEPLYSTEDGEIKIFNDTTKDILYEVTNHAKNGAFSTFKISSYPANFLNAGQCIFAIDSTAGSTWMGSEAPLLDIAEEQLVDFETVVRPIPQYDTENISMISQGPSICVFNKADSQEVLASWIFAQYLLTNDVQIAYAETEGYVPVTLKAQNSDEYQQYLSLSGTDNNEHYSIKIDATKLLIENTDKTFTTAVFNGSASLRQAAGELIEGVTKAQMRKQTVNEEFMEKLYSDVNQLYRLDSTSSAVTNTDLGPLPATSKALLTILALTWVGLAGYGISNYLKGKKKHN